MERAPALISTAWHRVNSSPILSLKGNASTASPSSLAAAATASCSSAPVCSRNRISFPPLFPAGPSTGRGS
jgi:hypothetical protein